MQTGRNSKKGNDHAVSEMIGFVIIFGIIIAGIGLVTLYGYPMLLQQQSSSNEQIMEKNMIVLQNDLKSLAYKTVPYSETSLNVGGGALTVYNTTYDTADSSKFLIFGENGNPLTCSIKNNNGNCAISSAPLTFYPGDLRYDSTSAQTGLSLENGAVVKRMLAENGSAMLAQPRWFYDGPTNTAVIYLIGFNTTTDIMAQTGVGTVKMDLGLTNYTSYNTAGDTIHIEYTPNINADYSTAWDNYFTGTLGMSPDGEGGYYFVQMPSTLIIYTYEVEIESV